MRILNTSDREKIRSIFLNTLNQSVFVVSVREAANHVSKMKCRSLPIKAISGEVSMKEASRKLFGSFLLKWPDFIEFDELNAKIVTKHSEERAFRVWSLIDYSLAYVIQHESLTEFKIW